MRVLLSLEGGIRAIAWLASMTRSEACECLRARREKKPSAPSALGEP